MSHYYIQGDNGTGQRWNPIKKDGTPYQRITKKMAEAAGARIGITTQIKNHMDTGFLFGWAGKMGIQAGIEAVTARVAGLYGVSEAHSLKNAETTLKAAQAIFDTSTKAAAKLGTAIHEAIETYIKSQLLSEDDVFATAQKEVAAWIQKTIGDSTMKAEHCVFFDGGITLEDGRVLRIANGATADLITRKVLADWKTVEMSGGKYYTGKPDHCAQLAFCRHGAVEAGLCDPDADCYNVYIDRVSGKIVDIKHWTGAELDKGLEFVGWAWECSSALERLEAEMK